MFLRPTRSLRVNGEPRGRPMRSRALIVAARRRAMSLRALITAGFLLAVAATGPPVDAQQAPKIAKIGFLIPGAPASIAYLVESFRQGLRDLGQVEGKTYVLELRYCED